MADKETQEPAALKKPGILENKLVMVAIMVAVQGGMAFAATKFLIQPASQTEETTAEAEAAAQAAARPRGVLVSLDEMIVSLNSAGRPRYLRTNIAVEAIDAKQAAVVEERMAEFRDAAIMALSNYEAGELGSFEGKESVKAQVKEALKGVLDEGEVLNVYYSDFVVQ